MLAENTLNKEDGVKRNAAWLPACELLKGSKDEVTVPAKSTS